ncbi:TRAP transporter substrate-binding protein [Xanthobacteraceae bacterium Astr-EGSB]|uniref:TRAP transporter substrate-binding protein n=1 Tax=Astrobacterium formosum TaxID=3069710 RepID=UPI0027B15B89|nr:TRAP transporter substrate-binding protein [Xanthobacteraceae bacterium Astr-EGSB]
MNLRRILPRAAIIGLVGTAVCAVTQPAGAQVRVILSNDNNAVGVKGQTFDVLKQEIEKRLGNKVKVEVHHSGTLFDQKTQVQGLQLGSVHLIAPTQGIYAPIAPKINALSLPFLLSTPEAVDTAMKDPIVRKTVLADLERKNILPVATWINGGRDFSYRGTKPILVPADLKGVKIRVQPVPADIKTMQALGANVSSMSWSEVPTALQQGVIDAVEPAPNALVGAGLHEMIDQVTRVNYQYSFYIVSVNKQWWEGLAPEIRTGLQEALKAATVWNWESTRKENDEAYDKVRKLGKKIHDLTKEQRAQWTKAVAPVWKEYGDTSVGAEVMARMHQIGEANQ